jgi:DNA-binding CsgD family transcriptional regulator
MIAGVTVYLAAAALISSAAGLAWGVGKTSKIAAAGNLAAALAAFSGFIWEGLFSELAAASPLYAGFALLARIAPAVSAPLQVFWGGRFLADLLAFRNRRLADRLHGIVAFALALIGAAWLLFPDAAAPAFLARALFFSALAVWAFLFTKSGFAEGAIPAPSGSRAMVAAKRLSFGVGAAALVTFALLDSTLSPALGPLDGLAVPVAGLFLSVAAFRLPGRLFSEGPAAIEGKLSPAFVQRHGLSPREADVAFLAAEGRTNAQIGELLFISPRTVENHLAAVYQKTGARNRTVLSRLILSRSATDR